MNFRLKSPSAALLTAALLSPALSPANPPFDAYPEKLYSYSVDRKGVTFQVRSGGCTSKSDFFAVNDHRSPAHVTLYRNVEDYCLALLPYGVPVHFENWELGLTRGQPFQIMNPMRSNGY